MTAPQPQQPGIGRILRPVPEPDESAETKHEENEVDELTKAVGNLPSLHPAALHGPLGDAVARIHPTTEAHPAGVLVQLIALIGALIGDGPHVVIGGSKHPARIWPLLIGQTGKGRKGEALSQARKFVSSFSSFSSSFVENCLASGLSSGEGLVAHFHNGGNDEVEQDRRLAVTEVEFARPLAASKREHSTLGPILRSLWEDDWAQVMTRSEPLKVSGIHLVVIGHITARELRLKLSDADVSGGTVNRFLPIAVLRSKLLDEEPQEPDTAAIANQLGATVQKAHHAPARRYQRSEAGQEYWRRIYRALSESDTDDGPLGEILARAPAYVLRLALLYAVLDEADEIEPEHLAAGLAIVKYATDSARTVFGDLTGGGDEAKLADALKNAGDQGLTRAQVSKVFSGNRDATALDALLKRLDEDGYLTTHKHIPDKGRPTTTFIWTNKTPPDPIGDLLSNPTARRTTNDV